jgi:beta-phosphoglucomutase-like phosphatase (HAD superfamily)
MLAIFDIDGTICDSQGAEDVCFSRAIEEVTGITPDSLDWSTFREPTSMGIVQEILNCTDAADPRIDAIDRRFLEHLISARETFPADFMPLPGAVDFIRTLQAKGICEVAIASGCFASEASYKLRCCGLELTDYPHATSTDHPSRAEIIALATKRAGQPLADCVYFGDAAWDVKVAKTLNIPLIAIGRRLAQLSSVPQSRAFRDYSDPAAIIGLLNQLSAT